MAEARKMIPFVKAWEGGYANVAGDKGGCTYAGVTIATYRQYYGADKNCADLKKITEDEWLCIFKSGYWDKMKADLIESQAVAELCVDMAWMSGTVNAIKHIQRALGLKDDGIIGPKTLGALNGNPYNVFMTLYDMRRWWFEQIAKRGSNYKFLKGWLNRLNDLKNRHFRG